MSSPTPEELWFKKLELDVLEECRGDALTFDELMLGFTDEDGDSNTSTEEIARVVDALISRELLVRTANEMMITTPAGEKYTDDNWPDESAVDIIDDDDL